MPSARSEPTSLDKIGILEFLEQDPRPSFVLEIKKTLDFGSGLLHPVVYNTALLARGPLLGAIVGTAFRHGSPDLTRHADFTNWVSSPNAADQSPQNSRKTFVYQDYSWIRVIVQNWMIISGFPLHSVAFPSRVEEELNVPQLKRLRVDNFPEGDSSIQVPQEWAFDPGQAFPHRKHSKEDADKDIESESFEPIASDDVPFKRLAEVNPAGIFFISPSGEVLWANDAWYSITDHPRTSSQMSFMDCLSEEHLPLMQAKWHELLVAKKTVGFDMTLRKRWYHEPTKTWKPVWIHADAAPELNSDGSLRSVMGCVRDISATRQAQEDQVEYTKVSAQLAYKTQQYLESEEKFAQMTSAAPCGIFCADAQGTALWANSKYCEMTKQPVDMKKHYPRSSYEVVAPEHYALLDEQFERLVVQKKQVSFEYRTTTPRSSPFRESPIDTEWHHCTAYPELNEDGSIRSIMGVLTDISPMKAAEALQIQKKVAAEEAKRQQEEFMDITSHELRNPLSAILQSADSVMTSLTDYQSSKRECNDIVDALVESTLDSVRIIMLCAQHQGRIINDVLTLSKLDSGLLLVSAIPTQPIHTMQQALKMFQAEISSYGISLKFHVEQSYHSLGVDWVLIDPARLTQVFINLMTNAIKFTKAQSCRMIRVRIGASRTRPQNRDIDGIEWFPTRSKPPTRETVLDIDDTVEGQLYLKFAVEDTGRGLSPQEKTRLFNRFSQANPRTHIDYGGSGLGLFISRELTERQGGEIGLKSVIGEGSTFVFYVKTQKTDTPSHQTNSRLSTITRQDSPLYAGSPDHQDAQPFHPSPPSEILSSASLFDPLHPRYNVLLVEDNLVNQRVLSKQLLKAGCTVTLANHGQEALDHLRSSTLWTANKGNSRLPNIILMDLEMPVMDGMTAVRHIREMQQKGELSEHIPVIAVTANARVEQVEASLQGGMDDVMAKPFLMRELLPKMEKLLDRGREKP